MLSTAMSYWRISKACTLTIATSHELPPVSITAVAACDPAIFVPVAQPLRGLIFGTLLVIVSSAVAIDGIVRGEPVVVLVGVGVLAVIFANEVLGKVWEAPTSVSRRWWGRRPRVVERERWLADQREHEALVEPVIAAADFGSWKAFYDGDPRRRGQEVVLGEIADGEFCWRVIWFPTTEVVAWPYRWRDERRHRALFARTAVQRAVAGTIRHRIRTGARGDLRDRLRRQCGSGGVATRIGRDTGRDPRRVCARPFDDE